MDMQLKGIDIPEFMYNDTQELITYTVKDLELLTKTYYDLGKQQGLSLGIAIGLILLGVVLFLVATPMAVIPG